MTRFIGVVHLEALPGSPRAALPLRAIIDRAVTDATALERGGVDGIIIENYHDVPFRAGQVDAVTVAGMTAVGLAVRETVSCDLGVNVLRNDAEAALAVAVACGATFIRVNIHSGAMLTDQGIIQGRAAETLRLRKLLDAEHVQIFADVLVKHAIPLGPVSLGDAARDTVERGLADAVIVTGTATGSPADERDIELVTSVTDAPVYVGSGVTPTNVARFVPPASGVIVGSWLKIDGRIDNPVDIERVRRLRQVLDERSARAMRG